MAKLFAGELAQRVAYDCMQLHGGMGYVLETDIARAWRDVRLLTIAGGTSEIMHESMPDLTVDDTISLIFICSVIGSLGGMYIMVPPAIARSLSTISPMLPTPGMPST